MNKQFFSKASFAIAIIGTFGAFSPSQVNAECWQHSTQTDCMSEATKCMWMNAVPMCVGEPKACSSGRAIYDEKKCRNIHGCYWNEPPMGFGFCTPIH